MALGYIIMAKVVFRYWGISPWEIEVLYGYFSSRFEIVQEEIEQKDAQFASHIAIMMPVAFNEEFFKWFEYRRWEKVKALFKEMKRRRGSGNAIRIELVFGGNRSILFRMDSEDKQWFDNSAEKMDFVLELLPYHTEKLPPATNAIEYVFDEQAIRWRLHMARAGERTYKFRGDRWHMVDEDA